VNQRYRRRCASRWRATRRARTPTCAAQWRRHAAALQLRVFDHLQPTVPAGDYADALPERHRLDGVETAVYGGRPASRPSCRRTSPTHRLTSIQTIQGEITRSTRRPGVVTRHEQLGLRGQRPPRTTASGSPSRRADAHRLPQLRDLEVRVDGRGTDAAHEQRDPAMAIRLVAR
jgi:hypothetical protein